MGPFLPDKCLYIIRLRETVSSIGAMMRIILKHLLVCDDHQYIPFVDLSYFKNVYLKSDEIGLVNPWEYFFEQPTRYGLQCAYKGKKVILSDADIYLDDFDYLEDEGKLGRACELYAKYVHTSSRIEKELSEIYNRLFDRSGKVLGVVCRGTDYVNRDVRGENRQPLLTDLIADAKECLKKWNCDKLFLATEDSQAAERFKEEFGDRLILEDKQRYSASTAITFATPRFDEDDEYLRGIAYLTDIYLLSKCDSLLSGKSGILYMALPMNQMQYEHKRILDLGKY